MKQRATTLLVVIGSTVALIGVIASFVYVLQPWRTCPGEDTPAGCAMLPQDAAGMTIAILATLVGVAAVVAGIVRDRAQTSRR